MVDHRGQPSTPISPWKREPPRKCGKHFATGRFSFDDCVFLQGHKKNLMVWLNFETYLLPLVMDPECQALTLNRLVQMYQTI